MKKRFIIYSKRLFLGLFIILIQYHAMGQALSSINFQGTSNPGAINPNSNGLVSDPNVSASGIEASSSLNNASAGNRFNFSGWTINSTLDTSKYFEFELQSNSGYEIDFVDFTFKGQRSNTGPTTVVLRSSIDGYASDINTTPIVFTGGGGSSAATHTISLSAAAFQNLQAPISFRLYAYNASATAGTFSINEFSINGSTGVLPVTLSYFDAKNIGEQICLNWETACEKGNAGFEIERSVDGIVWNKIGYSATKAKDGNSTITQLYAFKDTKPFFGINYYRLKQVGFDGEINYSKVVKVNFQSAHIDYEIYPNPAKHFIQINGLKGDEMISVNNLLGDNFGTYKGNSTMSFYNIPTGIYILSIIAPNNSVTQKKLIIEK